MHQYKIKQLDKVIQLHQDKYKALQVVEQTTNRKMGLHHFQLTASDKQKMYQKVYHFYDSKINAIYDTMNQVLKEAGHEVLDNPYNQQMKGERTNES